MQNVKEMYGSVTVVLAGELDHCTASQIRRQLDEILEDPGVGDLSFMDSSGIGVLLGRLRILQQRGGTLSVKNMQPPIEKLFRLTGLQRVIAVEHHQRGGRQ